MPREQKVKADAFLIIKNRRWDFLEYVRFKQFLIEKARFQVLKLHDVWRTCNKIRAAVFRVGLDLWKYYRPLDPDKRCLISGISIRYQHRDEQSFLTHLKLAIEQERYFWMLDIWKIVEIIHTITSIWISISSTISVSIYHFMLVSQNVLKLLGAFLITESSRFLF